MSSPNSAVDICNMALDHLKQEPITSIETPKTDAEVICARWYDADRTDLLRQHPWNFASKRAQLAPSSTPPLFGFSQAFDVPTDFLRLLPLNEDEGLGLQLDALSASYQFEQKQILTNATSTVLNLRYIFNNINVPSFDASFIQLLALKLAANMAKKFTGSISMANGLREAYEDKFANVASIDGQERPPRRRQVSRFLAARRGLGSDTLGGKYVVFT